MEGYRRNKSKRRKRKNFLRFLIKSVLCLAIASAVIIISFNFAVKTYSEDNDEKTVTVPVYNKEKDISSQVSEKLTGEKVDIQQKGKENEFDGIPLRNDNKGVPVICYHSITSDSAGRSSIAISKDKFRQQLEAIKDNGYRTLTMSQLSDYIFKNKPIPEKSVVITFDDGYKDNYTNVFPILKEFNMEAAIFVISGYLDREGYLTTEEIKEMSDYGIDIESHSVSHHKLSALTYENQIKEFRESKAALENITKKSVIAVAYPEGKYNNDTKKAVIDAGYTMGFTIQRGYADRDDNPAQLNRICIDYTYKPNNIINNLKNLKK